MNTSTVAPAGTSYAFIVAVEKYYSQSDTGDVLFAENDALAIKAALKRLGHREENIFSYINEGATNGTIQYEFKQLVGSLSEHDKLIFFFAGHGHQKDGKSYLMAYDSRWAGPEDTAISIATLYSTLAASKCKRCILFLDSCHSGMKLGDTERGGIQNISDAELKAYFEAADFLIAFSSCTQDQTSLSSYVYKHGIWTYHLLKALNGDAPDILDNKGRLLSHSLQDYLALNVPKHDRGTGL